MDDEYPKNYSRKIKVDNGDEVSVVSFRITKVYQDPGSRELSNRYNVHSPKGLVPLSLGSPNTEGFAAELFRFYSACGDFCGVSKKDLEKMDEYRVGSLEPKYLRSRLIEGKNILFPTEEFLKNQRIDLRESQ